MNGDGRGGRDGGRSDAGPEGRFSILDEVGGRRRNPTRRRALKFGALGVAVAGSATLIGIGTAGGGKSGESGGEPAKVGPGPALTPVPGRLAGPARTPLWTRDLDDDDYRAVVSGGTLVLAGRQVLAIDGHRDAVLWQNPDLRLTGLYDGPPIVVGDVLYGITGGGDLVALGVGDGQERWRAGAPDSTWLPSGIAGTTGDVVVCYGTTRNSTKTSSDYVTGLWGVDTRTQQLAWHQTATGDLGRGGVAVAPAAGVVALADRPGGTLLGYDARHGTPKWRIDDPQRASAGYSAGRLAAAGDAFFWGGQGLYKVDAESGAQRWDRSALGSELSPDIGAVFCPAADAGTAAGDATATGTSALEPPMLFATATLGTDPGGLFAFHTRDGSRVWKQLGDSARFGSDPGLARAGDVLLVSDAPSGSVYAVGVGDGATKWTFHDPEATVGMEWQVAGGGGIGYAVYGKTVRAFEL